MNDVLRTLIYDNEASLTLADTTEIVKEGIRLHRLSNASAYVFGKGMSAMTYMSSCLKEETGEISMSLKCDGEAVDIGISGNRALRLRGCIANPNIEGEITPETERRALGKEGSLTVIRDDGYNRPFVGTCALPNKGGLDQAFEEYYRISEQLPTRIRTTVEFGADGECVFAGVIAVQPLPFASESSLQAVKELDLASLLSMLQERGAAETAKKNFQVKNETLELRKAIYKCNCSREYLSGVLVTLGEEQLREIIRADGEVRVHCHYCNTDYVFTDEDADKLFARKKDETL